MEKRRAIPTAFAASVPASFRVVAAFSFLSPVLSVFMGWAILSEPLTPGLIGALILVAIGITLINMKKRQVPQKVA